jgi:hypothetical protein
MTRRSKDLRIDEVRHITDRAIASGASVGPIATPLIPSAARPLPTNENSSYPFELFSTACRERDLDPLQANL